MIDNVCDKTNINCLFYFLSGFTFFKFKGQKYEFLFDGDALPSDNSSVGFHTFGNTSGVTEESVYSISGGILRQNSTGLSANVSYYGGSLGGFETPTSATLSPGLDTVMEARLKVLESESNVGAGIFFQFYDGANRYIATFNENEVKVNNAPQSVDTTVPRTYRIFSPGNSSTYTLSIDCQVMMTGTALSIDPSYNGFGWGDGDSTPAYGGVAEWDFVKVRQGSDVNQPPHLKPIDPITVDEGETISFEVSATDPDCDELSYSASALPPGASFDSETRIFVWTPDYDSQGNYEPQFHVSDNGIPRKGDAIPVEIIVGNVNRSPRLVLPDPPVIEVDEGESVSFSVNAVDQDTNDILRITVGNQPQSSTFDELTGEFSWITDYNSAGEYDVLFRVADNGEPPEGDEATVTIIVGDVNQAPVLDPIGNRSVPEGQLLSFTVTATDPDGDALAFTADNLPPGAVFDEITQTFSWTPDYNAAGNYHDVEFTVTDDGDPIKDDFEPIEISVGDVNRPPVIDQVGDKSIIVGEALSFTVTASDPDGDAIFLSSGVLPVGASFDNLTGVFSWTPSSGQEDSYLIEFFAQDDGVPSLETNSEISVTVGENLTPRQKIRAIIETVKSLGLAKADRRPLLKPLRKARKRIGRNRVAKAIVSLERFIVRVNDASQSGLIDSSIAGELMDAANVIISDLQP